MEPIAGRAVAPAELPPNERLEQTAEEKEARLGRKGVLKLQLRAGSGLRSTDANGLADPYVVALLGKKEKTSRKGTACCRQRQR